MSETLVPVDLAWASAGELATGAVNKSLKDLEQASRTTIEQSRQVSMAAVAEMQETSKVLRTDTVALFERLREGNILLQEVLTGAHENLNSLERALVTRVADFVTALNGLRCSISNPRASQLCCQTLPLGSVMHVGLLPASTSIAIALPSGRVSLRRLPRSSYVHSMRWFAASTMTRCVSCRLIRTSTPNKSAVPPTASARLIRFDH